MHRLSVDSSAHVIHEPILSPLSVSKYGSPPSPNAISDPVGVYNLGRLCIHWCQNRDGRAAVGLCTVCALAQLDTAHSTIRYHWTQLHCVTEDTCICYSLTECYRQNSADSLCGVTDRHFVNWTVWVNTDVSWAVLLPVASGLLYIITQYELL